MEELKAELDALLNQSESNLTEAGKNRLEILLQEVVSEEE